MSTTACPPARHLAAEVDAARLTTRAVNHLRAQHAPAFLAALASTACSPDGGASALLVDALAPRRLIAGPGSYWRYRTFKGFDRSGRPEYRIHHIGGLADTVAEAWAVARLAGEPAFAQHPISFNNTPASPDGDHVFAYYLAGYTRRNRAIAAAAAAHPGSVVVSVDIRRFYDSVDAELAVARLSAPLAASGLGPDEQYAVRLIADRLADANRRPGLPTGPPLAHLMAEVYLARLDARLCEAFPGRAFRYSDDVAVVVPAGQDQKAITMLRRLVGAEGLTLNDAKTDVQPARAWREFAADFPASTQGLRRGIRAYLEIHPGRCALVRDLFLAEGFTLPSEWFDAPARGPAPRPAGSPRSWRDLWASVAGTPSRLIAQATGAREEYLAWARRLADAGLPAGGLPRKRSVSELRHVHITLRQLLDPADYGPAQALLPDAPELVETRAVYEAAIAGDATPLLAFPGKAVVDFARLWTGREECPPDLDWTAGANATARDAVATLAAFGLCEPPPDWVERFTDPGDRRFLDLLAGRRGGPRKPANAYLAEMSAGLLRPGLDRQRLMTTRFDGGHDSGASPRPRGDLARPE